MQNWACVLIVLTSIPVWAEVPGAAPGYARSIDEEQNEPPAELIVVPQPKPLVQPKPFVSDSLNKEFQNQYQIHFGYTAVEQDLLPTRFDDYFYNGLFVTYQEDLARKQAFGNYMIRRVAEYQADDFFKSNNSLRPVYETKDKISNYKVELQDGYKINLKYNLAGNYADAVLDSPYHVQFKLSQYVSTQETITTVTYPLTSKINLLGDYRLKSSVFRLIGSRQITPALSANITFETFTTGNEGDETVDGFIRQRLVLMGFTFKN